MVAQLVVVAPRQTTGLVAELGVAWTGRAADRVEVAPPQATGLVAELGAAWTGSVAGPAVPARTGLACWRIHSQTTAEGPCTALRLSVPGAGRRAPAVAAGLALVGLCGVAAAAGEEGARPRDWPQ